MDLTNLELAYLLHLLYYADKELFIYSSFFLRKNRVELEEVNQFIHNLINKIQNEIGEGQ